VPERTQVDDQQFIDMRSCMFFKVRWCAGRRQLLRLLVSVQLPHVHFFTSSLVDWELHPDQASASAVGNEAPQ